MTKRRAYQSFLYHSERIFSPLGSYDQYHDKMRSLWAKAYDDGGYKRLPSDPIAADKVLWEVNHYN